jgi:hypothetical protein
MRPVNSRLHCRSPLLALCAVAALSACGGVESGPPADAGARADAGSADAGADAGSAGGHDAGSADAGPADAGDLSGLAPHRWPDPPGRATHDTDANLAKVLERSALAGACDAVKAGAADAATRLRCGKAMFFDETFGTVGIPTGLLELLQKYYSGTYYGEGFSRFGMIADPDAPAGPPIGLRATTGKLGTMPTKAFTCAACHFGQLPDGRYAVGYGNLSLDYGRLFASMGAVVQLTFDKNSAKVIAPLRDELARPVALAKQDPAYLAAATSLALDLSKSSSGQAQLDLAEQDRFLSLRPGTMDFLTKPLIDDGVWTVGRISHLWDLPDAAQRAAAGMPSELLSWAGGVLDLETFLHGFVAIGKADPASWTDQQLAPLVEYLRTLRPPPLLHAPEPALVKAGAQLFAAKCLSCHQGPSGEGLRAFEFSEIGTDSALRKIFNPDRIPGGEPCCGLGGSGRYVVTGGVKSPRLAGVGFQTRLLHNGSVNDLEELFCLHRRDPSMLEAQTSTGHTMTCDGLAYGEQQALLAYLRSL